LPREPGPASRPRPRRARRRAFFAAGGARHFTFENVKSQQAAIESWYFGHPWQTALGFFALYVAVAALSLPGATLLTLIAGRSSGCSGAR